MRKPQPGQKPRVNALTFGLILDDLLDGTATRAELVEKTGLHWQTVNLLVTTLHRKGVIRIVGWENDTRGRPCVAAFQLGRGKDVPRPPPLTSSAKNRGYRERLAKKVMQLASAGVTVGAQA